MIEIPMIEEDLMILMTGEFGIGQHQFVNYIRYEDKPALSLF